MEGPRLVGIRMIIYVCRAYKSRETLPKESYHQMSQLRGTLFLKLSQNGVFVFGFVVFCSFATKVFTSRSVLASGAHRARGTNPEKVSCHGC